MTRFDQLATLALVLALAWGIETNLAAAAEADSKPVAFTEGDGRLTVAVDGLPIAVYCYKDARITRPFFTHVRAPNGMQVTRHHPPIEGQDLVDHDTFHPGIWMSFGDISGSDYWRIMAPVRHVKFVERPKGGDGKGTFAVRNKYLDQKDPSKVVCEEVARYTFLTRPEGYLIIWDSTFSSDKEFAFGDQEEMGLGFRVATPLRVEKKSEGDLPPGNGTIVDSEGRKNGDEVWGNSADWCDYSGTIAGQHVGITLFCHPKNFRPSWFHARDYGLLEANPFGRQAFGKGDKSSVAIKPGETMRLRYGVLLHAGQPGSKPDLKSAYTDYVELTK
jgi:hypothetical protein